MEVPAVHFPHTAALIKQELTDSDLGLMQSDYIQSGIPQTQYSLQVSTPPCWSKHEPLGYSTELAPAGSVSQNTQMPTADGKRRCFHEYNTVKSRDSQRDNAFEAKTSHEPTKYEMVTVKKTKHESQQGRSVPLSKQTSPVMRNFIYGDRSNVPLIPSFGEVDNPVVKLEYTSPQLEEQECNDTTIMLSNYARSEFSDIKLNFRSEDKPSTERCRQAPRVVVGTASDRLDSVSSTASPDCSISTSARQDLESKAESTDRWGSPESRQNAKRGCERLKRHRSPEELAPCENKRMKETDGHAIDFVLSDKDISGDPNFALSSESRIGNTCGDVEIINVTKACDVIGSTTGRVRSSNGNIRNTNGIATSTSGELKTRAMSQPCQPNMNIVPPWQTFIIPTLGLSQPQVSGQFHFLTKWNSAPANGHQTESSRQPSIRDKVKRKSAQDAKAQPGPKYLSELTTEEVEDLKRLPVDCDEDTLEPVFRVKCNTCSWAFRDLNSLVTHMSQQHDTSLEEPLRCELCEKSVRSEDHFFFYHESRVRVCTICGLSVDRLEEHMKSHNNPYGCRTCGKRFRHLTTIKKHLLEFEKHLPENKCPHCSLIIRMTGFSKHVNYHIHGFPYKCDTCPYECSSPSALGHHKIIHTGKKDKKCPYCDTWFLTEDRVKGHIQYKHTEKSFLCAICGVSYSVKKQFLHHMSIHDEEKKFKCDICGKKFQRQKHLNYHKQTKHESHPRVECAICGKSSSSKQALLQHMDVHRDEMPHECPVCKKKFKRKQNMTSHLRTHGEERKYKCEVCGDGFKWAHNLRNHMKTHNANKV